MWFVSRKFVDRAQKKIGVQDETKFNQLANELNIKQKWNHNLLLNKK